MPDRVPPPATSDVAAKRPDVVAPYGDTAPADAPQPPDAGLFALVKDAVWDFMDDNCMRMAAAMSYYTIFALPGLLVLLVTLLSWTTAATGTGDAKSTRAGVTETLGSATGLEGADEQEQIQAMMDSARAGGGPLKWLLTIGSILFAATGVIVALQDALNTAWEVQPDPEAGGVWNFLTKRLISLAMILAVGFLLLMSMTLTAAVNGFSRAIERYTGFASADVLAAIGTEVVTVAVVTALFGLIFKFLPDAHIRWKDAFVGGAVTGVLFWVGKFALGMYLGRANFAESFGAGAASLALVLAWVYYTSLIFLFGAEFTQKWAERRGGGIVPEEGAVRVRKNLERTAPAPA